jgi:hypothetical protein
LGDQQELSFDVPQECIIWHGTPGDSFRDKHINDIWFQRFCGIAERVFDSRRALFWAALESGPREQVAMWRLETVL